MIRAVSFAFAALLLSAAGEAPSTATGVLAQRGDVRFTDADLKAALGQLDPNARAQVTASPQAVAAFVRERVMNAAVLAEAKSKSWDTQPEVARRVAETRDAVILQTYLAAAVPPDPAYPSEAEIAEAYEINKGRFVMPRQYRVAQIVLFVKQGATPLEEEAAHKKAIDLRAQAMKPKADFADLARKSSQDKPSAEKGGDVGWLRETDMLGPVRDAVLTLPDIGVSQPVRVSDGWHVLKVLEQKPAGTLPLSEAKPQLIPALRQARAQRLIRVFLDDMLKAQPIQLNEIELTKAAGEAK